MSSKNLQFVKKNLKYFVKPLLSQLHSYLKKSFKKDLLNNLQPVKKNNMKLITYLKRNKMKQKTFAKKLSISGPYLSLILKGQRKPGADIAVKIESLTGGRVTVKELRK